MEFRVTMVLFSFMLLAAPSMAATEAELHSYLLKDYVKTVRPLKNVRMFVIHQPHFLKYSPLQASHTVNVSIGLTLQQIIDLDIKTNTLESQIWFNFGWTDEFLTWEDNDKFKDVRNR